MYFLGDEWGRFGAFLDVGFANPIFLWAMGLAAIPLWLHLSQRRKFRKLETGTLRFLEKAQRSRSRKSRWEEILLMLLRVGATILLALLFARPTFQRSHEDESGAKTTIVLLDASGSMTKKMTDAARASAANAIKKGGKDNGTVTLAQFSDQVEVLNLLEDFHPRPGAPTRLDTALNWALDHLLEIGNADSGRLVLIGHFANAALPEFPPRVWPSGIEVELIPLLPEKSVNSSVTDIELRTPYKTDQMELEARLLLPSEGTAKVTIQVEGYVEEQTVSGGSERVLFHFRPTRELVRGWIGVESEADGWPWDDRRPFVFQWAERSRILLIDGDPGETPFEGEAYFLKKALEASGAEHGLSPFEPEISYGLQNRQGLTNLSQYDAVALCGVGEISVAEAKLLKQFVDNGGGLLLVLGNGWGPALYSSLVDLGLFPQKSSDNEGETEREIASWDSTHPVFKSFGTADGGDLRSLTWHDGYEIQADENWKPLAVLDGGRPILLGNDRVIVCPHPLNRDWTDLPREPIFVPFVKSLFTFLAGAGKPPKPIEIVYPGAHENREQGWYLLPDETTQVVLNNPDDANVTVAELSEVARALGLPMNSIPGKSDVSLELKKAQAAEVFNSRPYELWPWIAVLLLIWFIFEGCLATAPPQKT